MRENSKRSNGPDKESRGRSFFDNYYFFPDGFSLTIMYLVLAQFGTGSVYGSDSALG
jgi:hypothetical protein